MKLSVVSTFTRRLRLFLIEKAKSEKVITNRFRNLCCISKLDTMDTSKPEVASNTGDLDYWGTRWLNQRIGWHNAQVDKFLLKYFELVTGKTLPVEPLSKDCLEFKQNSSKTWFVPLCGKTVDIPFLLSLGYKVFAIEGVRQAIATLSEESKLPLEFNEADSVFVGEEGRLKVYYGDLYQCPIETFGTMDYVWDRGSLVAVEYASRDTYKSMMQRSVKKADGTYHDFVYLLEAVCYDRTHFGGPPRSVDDNDMEKLYKDWAEVRFLEKVAMREDHSARNNPGIGPDLDDTVYLIRPKHNSQ